MRIEHRPTADERDAFGKARFSLNWRPGERKAIKRRANRRDRRAARQGLRQETRLAYA